VTVKLAASMRATLDGAAECLTFGLAGDFLLPTLAQGPQSSPAPHFCIDNESWFLYPSVTHL
jgi:hypothetical protein